jgi:MFS family permease
VLAVGEYRALFAAGLLSVLGDQLARVAVAVVVYSRTGSALLAAAAFGVSYLAWVAGGPVLSAAADRFPRRAVMAGCDVARTAVIGLVAAPGLPVLVLAGLLVVAALFEPPFRAAASAALPDVLGGDLLVVGAGLNQLSGQLAQVLGFAAGGAAVALVSARGAILADAATFAVSAAVLRAFLRPRAAPARQPGEGWLRSAGGGFRLVLGDPVLRSYLVLALAGGTATTAPEGLMAALAVQLGGGARVTGALLAAMPAGTVLGAVLYVRFTRPALRWRLVRPMAVLSCAALLPLAAGLPLPAVLALLVLAGYGTADIIVLNARYIQAVPATHRARAFAVAASGLAAGQGLATIAAGALAGALGNPALTAALCGLAGMIAMLPALTRWPAGPPPHDPARRAKARPGSRKEERDARHPRRPLGVTHSAGRTLPHEGGAMKRTRAISWD